jgi:hypothetical protein
MRRTFIFIIALLLSGISIFAEDKETEGILDARDKAIGKANKEAVKKLEKIMSAKTQKGDLDGALSIKNLIAKIKGETVNGDAVTEEDQNDPFSGDEFLGGNSVKKQIESRYLSFARMLIKDDVDGAYDYVDPRTREAAAPAVIKGYLKLMAGLLDIAQLQEEKVKVKSITLGIKGNEAKVIPSFKVGANWEAQKGSYWVKRNDKWFLGDEKELENFK